MIGGTHATGMAQHPFTHLPGWGAMPCLAAWKVSFSSSVALAVVARR
jgi:hypothetical protein